MCSYSYFRWCENFSRSLDVICYDRWVLSGSHKKLLEGLVSHELTGYLSVIAYFYFNELWVYYVSKTCKPDNFELHNSLKLSFSNILVFRSNFVDCESFLQSKSSYILALCEKNLDDSIDSGNFSVRGYLPLTQKDATTLMHDLAVYMKEGLPFGQDLSLENSIVSHLCFWLALLHSVSYFFFLFSSPDGLW